MTKLTRNLLAAAIFLAATGATAQQVPVGDRTLVEAALRLKSGQFVWAPELSPAGPTLLVVNLETQRAILFRNGVPIGASTISSGKPGHETPTGVFSILQKRKEHYSSTYNNAPMPNMQRLTWKGIALHAGNLPGYPASHGCIRLPHKFSALLFDATKLGMTVVITSIPAAPISAAAPAIALASPGTTGNEPLANAPFEWHPERATEGMVSVVISNADQRAIVMRGGAEIGSAPARVGGALDGGVAYVLRAWDATGQQWIKLQFSGSGQGMDVSSDEGKRFETPVEFRRAVAGVLRPGSVVIVTPESLKAGSPGGKLDIIKEDGGS